MKLDCHSDRTLIPGESPVREQSRSFPL